MSVATFMVNSTIKSLTRIICRVEDEQLDRVPLDGPLILVTNHVNFLDVPLLYTHLLPRPVTGFAKAETWDNPAMALLFNLWQAIPIRRGEPDRKALRLGLDALRDGKILAIAPEGTRSGHGRLGRGRSGVALLALRSEAPLLPVVYYGGEILSRNLTRLQRTEFHIVVGSQFYLQAGEGRVDRHVRQQMADEIMYQLAALLPPHYRGKYSELSKASETYLHFPTGSRSNLGESVLIQ
jgi:1-acyl-sn-glycerol-3-phosphate acyltransferase